MACQKEDQEMDRISHLLELLTDKILSLMPIRDAVRTSVLSSKWRFKWTSLSKLVFDDNCTAFRGNGKSICSLLVNIVDSVLLLHSGGIKNFELSHRQYRVTADVDRWILHLSKISINSFCLCIHKGTPYKVPSCLFSCQSLTCLDLYNCSLNIPPTFRGFKNLKTLNLQLVHLSQQVLEDLISGCCLLANLTLYDYHFQNLIIDAPMLEILILGGVVEGISLTNTFSAPSFHMDFNEDKEVFPDAPTGYINLLRFFDPIRNVEALTLYGHVLKYLSIQEVPALLAEPFLRLKTLVIGGVNFKNVKEVLVILCLLQSAPNLEKVNFSAPEKGDYKTIEHIVGMDDYCSGDEIYESACFTFAHLKYARLIGIHHDSALEMGFAGLLLSSSPALQKMTIKVADDLSTLYPKGSGQYKLLKHILRRQCASTSVELVFMHASDP